MLLLPFIVITVATMAIFFLAGISYVNTENLIARDRLHSLEGDHVALTLGLEAFRTENGDFPSGDGWQSLVSVYAPRRREQPEGSEWIYTKISAGYSLCFIAGAPDIYADASRYICTEGEFSEPPEYTPPPGYEAPDDWVGMIYLASFDIPYGQSSEYFEFLFSELLTYEIESGEPEYYWRISGDDLPAGLFFNTMTGLISGTTTEAGTYDITIEVVRN